MNKQDFEKIQNLFVIDIETVPVVEDFEQLSERFQALWTKKAANIAATLLPSEAFEKRSAVYSEFAKVVCIGIGVYYLDEKGELRIRVKSMANMDEKVLLQQFSDFCQKFPNKRLAGHNCKEFDFPFLGRRMLVNGVTLPDVLKVQAKKPWELPFLDTMEMWSFGDKKAYTSLDLLAALFDVPSSKSEMDGSQVGTVFYKDKDLKKIEKYCKADIAVTAQVLLKLLGYELVPEDKIEIID